MFLDRFIPRETPDYARHTVQRDSWSAVAAGVTAAGGAATAAVIAKKYFDAPDSVVALLFSAHSIGLLLSPLVPRAVQRWGAVRTAFNIRVVGSILLMTAGACTSSFTFVLALCLAYIVGSALHPAVTRVARQNYPTSMRGKLVAISRVGGNASMAIGGFFVGQLLNVHPETYAWIFPLLGVAGLAGAVVYRTIRVRDEESVNRDSLSVGGSRWKVYVRILRTDHRYALFMVAWYVFGFSNLMAEPIRAIYVSDARFAIGADYMQSLLILLVIPQATVLLTLNIWGKLLDRYPVSFIRASSQVMGVGNLILFIFAPNVEWLCVASVLRGLQMAGAQMTWSLAMMEFAPRSQVTEYTAIHTFLAGSRISVAPWIGAGLTALVGPHWTFGVAAFLSLISVGLFMVFPRITVNWKVPEGAPTPRVMPGREHASMPD
jgi:hypothetical protein